MSKFKVGDRVRIVGADFDKTVIGTETTIVGYCAPRHAADGKEGWFVDLPTATGRFTPSGYRCCQTYHLEPVYDGNERVSWSSCVWQPSSVRA